MSTGLIGSLVQVRAGAPIRHLGPSAEGFDVGPTELGVVVAHDLEDESVTIHVLPSQWQISCLAEDVIVVRPST